MSKHGGVREPADELLRRLEPSIRQRVACKVPESDVDDVAQEALADVWRGYAKFRHGSRVETWAHKCASRAIARYYRERARRDAEMSAVLADVVDDDADPFPGAPSRADEPAPAVDDSAEIFHGVTAAATQCPGAALHEPLSRGRLPAPAYGFTDDEEGEPTELEAIAGPDYEPHRVARAAELQDTLSSVLAARSTHSVRVFERSMNGERLEDIAHAERLPLGTVKWEIWDARRQVRERIS